MHHLPLAQWPRGQKIIGYQGYPRAIAMENLFCLISSPGEDDFF
jgi:hypothetical protein